MIIGGFGDVIFRVSDSTVKTIKSLTHKSSANYSTHAIVRNKGLAEFTGINPCEITMTMELFAQDGVDPIHEYERLQGYVEEAEAHSLVIGNHVYGTSWVAKSVSLSSSKFDTNGRILVGSVSINLLEYSGVYQ